MARESGIFLHITSLPSEFGIGDLGNGAKKWIDTLSKSNQKVWQICPVGPTGYGFSPYMSMSAFAGNPLFISPQLLVDWGYLSNDDLSDYPKLSENKVEFSNVEESKNKILKKAFKNFSDDNVDYQKFIEKESYWLDDWAVFLSLTEKYGSKWYEWPKEYKLRNKNSLKKWINKNKEDIKYHKFVQFIYHSQWFDMKEYAHNKGVKIFGDIPFYVAYDSCDVWANQSVFELDEEGRSLRVGGVPPDYFSEDGQLWGNPLYRWDVLKENDYDWWIKRMERTFYYCDIVRIDHFRAFEAYWAIPADSPTAKVGEWVKGPDNHFFEVLKSKLGDCNLVAEDLGIITDEVVKLRLGQNLPGMKIFQFAFDGNPHNWYLPYNCGQNAVIYTGTHDNDTTLGWIKSLSDDNKKQLLEYLNCSIDEAVDESIRAVQSSVCNLAVIPLVDVLHLDSDCRFNIPGVADGNWSWRFTEDQIDTEKFNTLSKWTEIYGRA